MFQAVRAPGLAAGGGTGAAALRPARLEQEVRYVAGKYFSAHDLPIAVPVDMATINMWIGDSMSERSILVVP